MSPIPLPTDTEAAYAIYDYGALKRLVVINYNGYNTTKDGAGVEPLPNPPSRPSRNYAFDLGGHRPDVSVSIQRLMANGSDAITGVTFDGWSYNMELDNGKPVRLHNVTTGEVVRADKGVVTINVPYSSAVLLDLTAASSF